MMNKDEATRLQRVCEGFTNPVEFVLHQTQDSEFGHRLDSFVGEACSLSQGKIRAVGGSPDPALPAYPCFRMRKGECSNIIYAAVPSGHQFTPFIDALESVGRKRSTAQENKPSTDGLQAELQVLISEHCPRCPLSVAAAVLLSSRHSSISTFIIDAGQFSELTQKYGIKSVPATILDRRLVLIGNVSTDKLMDLLKSRGTLKFEMEVVQSLIDRARISEAAESLVREAGRDVILALLQSPDFAKRLSALVIVEKALDDQPDTVRALVPALVKMLSHTDSRIRGDIADLLGKIGNPQAVPQLELLIADPDPDVAEAALEAIAELRKFQ
jgi:hypothetical protein